MSDNSSENSLAKSDAAVDLTSKYSRLATEYSKLRAQNTVLKKAVLDEQAKKNELNDTLRFQNQKIRKTDQEMEALKFRNSQLSVRITVLQDELQLQNNKSNKKSKNSENPNGISGNSLLTTEIEKTMMEHAKLISELSGKDEMREEEVKLLKNEISSLTYELEQKNIKMTQILEERQTVVQQLKNELKDMQRQYAQKVIELKENEVELSTLKNVHKTYVEANEPKLEAFVQLLPKKIPFADEENSFLNRLNVRSSIPFQDKESHVQLLNKHFASLLLSFSNIMHNVTLELKDLGLEELKIYIKTLLKDNDGIQLCEKLNASYHLLNNIGLESSDPNTMQKIVHEFVKTFLDFAVSVQSSYFKKNHSSQYDTLFAHQSVDVPVKVTLELFQMRKNELVAKVITLPNSQHSIIHDEFEHFNEAVQNLVAAIDLIDKNRKEFSSKKPENNVEFERKAISYLRSLKRDPNECIPYEVALKNKIQLEEYKILNDSLKQEIKILEDRIAILEQNGMKIQCSFQLDEDSNICNIDSTNSIIHEKTSELGKFISTCEVPAEILAREKEILKYVNDKLCMVVVEKQEALSRARNYILECKALRRRLEYCVTEKQLLEQKYLTSHKASTELKEELNIVSQNYESHLSVMSEHLANVNEKLATQSDEIDKLHYQLNNKVLKKNKSK